MQNKVYFLDNASTTKMFEEAQNSALNFLGGKFYNPSAVYDLAVEVRKEIENARKAIFDLLGAEEGKLVFTGSATEANNMVIFSFKNFAGKKFLFGAGEHPSVLECAKELKNRGANVEFIPLNKDGCVDKEAFSKLMDKSVYFVSVQHVSNETGAINDIKSLVKIAKKVNKDVLFHSDGVQAFCKLDFSLADLGVDYYTISAHKIGGPKGIGALYIKKGSKISPLIFGGGQEEGLRSGTENVFNIMAFKSASLIASADLEKNQAKLKAMRKDLLDNFSSLGIDYTIHGDGVPNILSICLSKNVRGETLLHALEKRQVYVSTGSACSSSKHFNSTLEAMGIDKQEILSSIRISMSPYAEFDAKDIAQIIKEELEKLEQKTYGKLHTN